MSILLNEKTRVIVQGITGRHGSFHALQMTEYGTNIVAGVTPGKGGSTVKCGAKKIPVYDSVKDALKEYQADYSIIFVPALHALAASVEALESNLNIVIITEHIPVHDVVKIVTIARDRNLIAIGPNCPGIIAPGKSKIGIMPGDIFKPGNVGILSRSGTLTYEVVKNLSDNGVGQSTVVGIGGDMVKGFDFIDGLKLLNEDSETESIFIIGEIGGDDEERAASYIGEHIRKPVFAYIAGQTAPEGKTMGHAGAIIMGNSGTYLSKINSLKNSGVTVVRFPYESAEVFR